MTSKKTLEEVCSDLGKLTSMKSEVGTGFEKEALEQIIKSIRNRHLELKHAINRNNKKIKTLRAIISSLNQKPVGVIPKSDKNSNCLNTIHIFNENFGIFCNNSNVNIEKGTILSQKEFDNYKDSFKVCEACKKEQK